MNNTIKIYIVFFILFLAGIIYIDAVKPKPVNWFPSYDLTKKDPFGLYVLDKESSGLFKENEIQKVIKTLYEFFNSENALVDVEYDYSGTIFLVSEKYNLDSKSDKELFYFVGDGNTAFISCKDFPEILMDSLNFSIDSRLRLSDTVNVWMANKNLGLEKYNLNIGAGNIYFSEIDTLTTTVLGYQGKDNKKEINFIKVPYKEGYFYLHTQPASFTNYHLLKDNHFEYTEKILSYIPEGNLFWLVKDQNGEIASDSPLRYVLSQPALKWAWLLFLSGMLLFIIFNAKRKQRIVPILKPLANTTVDFTKTIGNLYYQEGDHQNIINKKIIYFFEKIRNEYLIDTTVLDENFEKKLQLKTGKNIQDIKELVWLIKRINGPYYLCVEEDLIEINNAIEKIIS
ncbi:hypothetical protein SAMN05443543_101625 [Flavobacterium flevense]|uniref:DUF4350 domain-containing protein n=1 Tax=Flavobacterium flevense TaxID=983 RepID=A0A4Y4AX87_9FLAO|nr:hypothetical protein [Flavobacterium flevense]GEC71752.1 hypothetical protein FFL01_12910 [Flavobacterium flevense]SHL38550.1 hypothetical protein SAMN05443543_101625 [Flavobacterium flevense]